MGLELVGGCASRRAPWRLGGGRREARGGGSWACSWRRFNAIVEVDERVEFLERERLRGLIVNEYTLPFLSRLLIALEYYHFIVIDCGSLNPNRGYFPARVHLECAWLGRIYRWRLVIIS